jgi:hypothetical protein
MKAMILTGNQPYFELQDIRLFSSVLNEVLNGFVVDDVDATIGMKRAELQQLLTELNKLRDDSGIKLDLIQTRVLRNALRITLSELGIEEFHTRTGFDFQAGKRVLRELEGRLQDS